jgi:hypothetical protein
MKNIVAKLLLCAALLACIAPTRVFAGNNGHHQSGVTGQVQSQILFHNWNVLVISDTGKLVADFLTDADGSFQLNLKPGTYVLTAYYPDFGPYRIVWGTSVEVTIEQKGFETVFLPVTLPPL